MDGNGTCDNNGIINCPDCQLETLQHQQNQRACSISSPSQNSITRSTAYIGNEAGEKYYRPGFSNSEAVVSTDDNPNTSGNLEQPTEYGMDNRAAINSMIHAHGNITSPYPLISPSNCNLQSSTSETTLVRPPVSSGNDMDVLPAAGALCGSNNSLEGCDVTGYCPTCAILDLPPTDQYYRSTVSRAAVFPTLYYGQGPSLPGFSPLSDCTPWSSSSDFTNYPYSQLGQSNASPSTTAIPGHFNPSSTLPSLQSPLEAAHTAFGASLYTYCSRSASEDDFRSIPVRRLSGQSSNAADIRLAAGEKSIDNVGEGSLPSSSRCISVSSEDSTDSGSLVSQKELIVEDVNDDDGQDSLRLCELDRQLKCLICQNQMRFTECNSPQLANILENLHEDISAVDLDISVSSGDIEIGGVEDEVRDLGSKTSGFHHTNQLNLQRLSGLLSVPIELLCSLQQKDNSEHFISKVPTSLPVNLCNKCFKLASLADNLEKQLQTCCAMLKQNIQQQIGEFDENGSSRFRTASKSAYNDLLFSETLNDLGEKNGPHLTCKVTQTEEPFGLTDLSYLGHSSKESSVPIVCSEKESMYVESDVRSDNCPTPFLHSDSMQREIEQPISTTEGLITHADVELPPLVPGRVVLRDLNCIISDDVVCPQIPGKADALNFFDSDLSVDVILSVGKYGDHLCDRCGIVLHSVKAYNIHVKRHQNELSFSCDSCQKGFPTMASLVVHRRCHTGEKPYQCTQCDKSFSTKSNLKGHERIHHSVPDNPESLNCSKCGIVFRTRRTFESHLQKCDAEEMFPCDICGKKFTTKHLLQGHLLSHTGLKPYKCTVCSISFSRKGNLGLHMRIHNSSKLFQCDLCNKGFNRKQALEIHQNRHKGLRAFRCNLCDKSFFDPGNLKNHKKKHLQ